jgi:two-component system CheB/CheR fusion protein
MLPHPAPNKNPPAGGSIPPQRNLRETPPPPSSGIGQLDPADASAWLAALLDSAEDAIFTQDLDDRILSWNHGAQRLFGYTAAEAVSQPVALIVPPDRLYEQPALLQRIRQGDLVEQYETVRRRKDGSLVEVSLTASPVRDHDGRIIGATKIVHEITEKRRAEEKNRQFAAIVESSDDAIFSNNLQGAILSWNLGAERLFGYTAAEVIGRPTTMLIPLGRHDEEAQILPRIRRGERVEHFETVRRRKDGSLIDVSLTVSPLQNASGHVIGASKIARDIGDRKRGDESARRLAAIVECSDDAIISKNLDGIIQSWNRAAERLFGYTAAEAVGQSVLLLIPEGRHDEEPAILERLRRGERIDHYETVRRRKDGALLDISLSVSPIVDGGGRVVGASKIARDITAQKRVQRELREAHERALAANRAKDNFLATLSHELRTPLNPVLLLASEAAQNASLPASVRADFEAIRKGVELEARLIDDLLDVARITKGKLVLNTADHDLHAILRDAITTVRPDLEAKQQTLACDLAASSLIVRGDATRLQQVLWNVLKNAVKFTPEHGCISVGTRINHARHCAVVEISDTGIGLAREDLERIFDAFNQVAQPQPAGHRFGGLGLGLTISRLLTELHRGTIRAQSEGRGRGATFVLELPLAPGNPPPPAAADKPATVSAAAAPEPKRILLIEDHEASRTALAHLLRRRKFEVVPAGSAAEARTMAGARPFDLAVVDIGLPDADGVTLIEELVRSRHMKAIALTGFGMEEDIKRSQAAGALAHLTKPISIQALDKALAASFGSTAP